MLLQWKNLPFLKKCLLRALIRIQINSADGGHCLCDFRWVAVTVTDIQVMNSMFPIFTVQNQQ